MITSKFKERNRAKVPNVSSNSDLGSNSFLALTIGGGSLPRCAKMRQNAPTGTAIRA